VRNDAFLIWWDTPPQLSIEQSSRSASKGGRYWTHTAYIDQQVILNLHANILDSRQSDLSFMIRSNSDRSVFKARSPEPRKPISVYAHHDDLRSFIQLAISVPDRCKGLTSDRTHGQRTNTCKLIRGSWLTSLTIILFTRVAPHTKRKEAPDQCSTHLLLLSARVSSRTKSKGLHRYVLQIYYFINQVFKSFYNSTSIIIDSLALP
jgi:hypothetical protein